MAAINTCTILGSDFSQYCINIKIQNPFSSLPCSHFPRPNLGPKSAVFTLPSRLRVSYRRNEAVKPFFGVPRISCLLEDTDGECAETEQPFSPNSQQEASIDLKLPRRSLLVSFTCDACGVRSQRLINRLAYERGLVYVQCSGCSRYHKLVDNLGLVVEYSFQEEIDLNASADQS